LVNKKQEELKNLIISIVLDPRLTEGRGEVDKINI
jgi:hypothetical protein